MCRFSPPFEVPIGGYQFTLQVHPAGHTPDNANHVSVYLKLMKVPNDDQLVFPVCSSFELALVPNPDSPCLKYSRTLDFGAPPGPTPRCERNGPGLGLGWGAFTPHTSLNRFFPEASRCSFFLNQTFALYSLIFARRRRMSAVPGQA